MPKEKVEPQTKREAYEAKPSVGRFKVLVGKHQEGYTEDGSLRIYKKGEVVESKSDLTRLNGVGPAGMKFEALDKGRGQRNGTEAVPFNQSVAPGGQVSTGFQQTTVGSDGEPVSGPVPPDAVTVGMEKGAPSHSFQTTLPPKPAKRT